MSDNHDMHDLEYLEAEHSSSLPLKTYRYRVTVCNGVVTIEREVENYDKFSKIIEKMSQEELEKKADEFTEWFRGIAIESHVITEIENGERWLKSLGRTGFEEWQYEDYSYESFLKKNNISYTCDGSGGWKIQYKLKDCEPVEFGGHERPEKIDTFWRLLNRKK